jgi:hypothetical protein
LYGQRSIAGALKRAGRDYARFVAARPQPLHTVPPHGLCDSCAHQRIVKNTRGSRFSLCELSREDSSYPRYPRLPVTECRGYQPRAERADA